MRPVRLSRTLWFHAVVVGIAAASVGFPAFAQKQPRGKPAATKPAPNAPAAPAQAKPPPKGAHAAPKEEPKAAQAAADAGEAPKSEAASAHEVVERESRIEFDERMVRGQAAAGAIYLFQRAPSEFKSIVQVPDSFRERTTVLVAPHKEAP